MRDKKEEESNNHVGEAGDIGYNQSKEERWEKAGEGQQPGVERHGRGGATRGGVCGEGGGSEVGGGGVGERM